MRKNIALLLVFCFLFLTACSSDSQTSESIENITPEKDELVKQEEYKAEQWKEKELEGIHFSIPTRWREEKGEDDSTFYAESGLKTALLYTAFKSSDEEALSEKNAEAFIGSFGKAFDDFQFEKKRERNCGWKKCIEFFLFG